MKETILVAMTGGLESTVSAYLLKKQGHHCIGMAVMFFDPKVENGPFVDYELHELERIRSICKELDMPFYAVNAFSESKYFILKPLIGRVLSGHSFSPFLKLNKVMVDILEQKMTKLKAHKIALGHYAKIVFNHKLQANEVVTHPDLKFDQSYLLAELENDQLGKIILPLSEMRKEEVKKVAELSQIKMVQRSEGGRTNIMTDPRMANLVNEFAAPSLCRSGNVFDYRLESIVGDHPGIQYFYIGKNNLKLENNNEIDADKSVVMIVPYKGSIFIDYLENIKCKDILISRTSFVQGLDLSIPFKGFVLIREFVSPTVNSEDQQHAEIKLKRYSAMIYPKNSQLCHIVFDEEVKGMAPMGMTAVIYTREKDKGKIIGHGTVEMSGNFNEHGANTLPDYKNKV